MMGEKAGGWGNTKMYKGLDRSYYYKQSIYMQSKSWSRLSRKKKKKTRAGWWGAKSNEGQKKCGSYEEGERNLSLQSPVSACQLSAGCWYCGNESVLDSPLPRITQTLQSSNQTHNPRHRKPFWSVKPPNGTSIWMLRVCAALLSPCAPTHRYHVPHCSQGFDHSLTRTTLPLRRQDSLSLLSVALT